jgi:hypothetical protein
MLSISEEEPKSSVFLTDERYSAFIENAERFASVISIFGRLSKSQSGSDRRARSQVSRRGGHFQVFRHVGFLFSEVVAKAKREFI